MFTATKGLVARADTACSHRATSSLPVPCSPVIRTFASEGPTRAITSRTGRIAADCEMMAGPALPLPRRNGELVFAEPWESRAFGLAMTLNAGGVFDWEEFRQHLIRAVAEHYESDWPATVIHECAVREVLCDTAAAG